MSAHRKNKFRCESYFAFLRIVAAKGSINNGSQMLFFLHRGRGQYLHKILCEHGNSRAINSAVFHVKDKLFGLRITDVISAS